MAQPTASDDKTPAATPPPAKKGRDPRDNSAGDQAPPQTIFRDFASI